MGIVVFLLIVYLSMVICKDSVQCFVDFMEYECSLLGFGIGVIGVVFEIIDLVKVFYMGRYCWFFVLLKLLFFFFIIYK